MELIVKYVFVLLWIIWAFYWLAVAKNTKSNARKETIASRASHFVPLAIAAVFLWFPLNPNSLLTSKFVQKSGTLWWIGLFCTIAGLFISVWARRYLGKNWSAAVTVKQEHELVRSGPYKLVRHPIYTGLILAFFGSVIASGEWRGLIALLIVVYTFWRKLKHEEHWMLQTFGLEYLAYRSQVKALIPFVI